MSSIGKIAVLSADSRRVQAIGQRNGGPPIPPNQDHKDYEKAEPKRPEAAARRNYAHRREHEVEQV
jgi:hypothetical protein